MSWDLICGRWERAVQGEGCPACRIVREASDDYLAHLVREGKMRQEVYDALLAARGFCERHTARLCADGGEKLALRMGLARLYGWMLDPIRAALPDEGPVGGRARQRRRRHAVTSLAPRAECPACLHEERYAASILGFLVELLDGEGGSDFQEAYLRGSGLCLGHFRQLLGRAWGTGAWETLVQVQRDAAAGLSAELKEYLRKHDYRYSHEPYGSEKDAWIRAIEMFVGPRPDP